MPTYTIQSILGHETGVQIGDRTFDAYTIQLAEDQRPVRLLRTPGNAPSLGPVQGEIIESDRGPRFKIAYGQQQTTPQPSATYVPSQQATPYQVAQQVAQQPSPDYEARQHSIIRQHSQEMALRAYVALYGGAELATTPPPPNIADFWGRLRPLIDWFDADARQKHEPVQVEPSSDSEKDIPF